MIIGCKTRRTRGKGVQDGRFHWPGNSVGNGVSRVFLRLALPMVLRLAYLSSVNIEQDISQSARRSCHRTRYQDGESTP